MVDVPVLRLPLVYHVGSLDPSRRGELHRTSQEGLCLSVSLCPGSWAEIARLGGSDLFALERAEGVFLDVLTALGDPAMRDVIVRWSEAEGLIVYREQWKAWTFDDELDEWSHFLADSREAAEAEVDDFASGPDGGPAVELHMGYAATEELGRRLGSGPVDVAFALDFAAMLWARDAAPAHVGHSFDGVWFDEEHAPEELSAPRGGIFPEAVARWTARSADWDEVDDEDALADMPEPVLVPSLLAAAAPAPR